MTLTASRKDPGTKPPAPAARRRGLTSRPVVSGGVVVSTFITIADGIRPPGHGPYLLLGGMVVWLVTGAALVILTEVLRRYWRAAGRQAIRYSRRGGGATLRGGARLAGHGLRRGRTAIGKHRGDPLAGKYSGLPPGPWLMSVTSKSGQAISGFPGCVPGERPGSSQTLLSIDDCGDLIRRLEAAELDPDLTVQVRTTPPPDPPPKPPQAAAPSPGDDPAVTTPPPAPRTVPRPGPGPVPRRRPAAAAPVIKVPLVKGQPSAAWAAVAAEIEAAEWHTDTELLAWMREQILGITGVAEAYVTTFEKAVVEVGLTTAAIGAVHDTADCTAEAAGIMAQARSDFAQYYEGYRQWAAEGGQSPHDGHFITGEDD